MEADSFRIAKVFSNGGDIHFRLPYFQREYAWDMSNWQTLLNDILDLYNLYQEDKTPEHFLGSLVVVNEGMLHGTVPVFKLVDGQQRLTTITLMLCALAELAKPNYPEKYAKIRKYITNPDEKGELKYKLLPTTKYNDRNTYISIINGTTDTISVDSNRIYLAYEYFRKEFSTRLNSGEFNIDQLFLVIINSLQVVFINLNYQEKPYQIFESLNAKGKPLTQADLVRNYIAMKLPEARQPKMFDNHWSKIEDLLQEKRQVGRSGLGELTAFLRHYLAFRNGVLGKEEHVYARFRDRIEANFRSPDEFENEVIILQKFAGYYDRFLRTEHEGDKEIRQALARLNIFEFSTGYPFLLALYDSYINGTIIRNQILEALNILENYMVRRYLTGEPTNYLNKVFPALWKDIDTSDFIPSLKEVLLQRNYPADYAVHQKGVTRRLYDNSSGTRAKTALVLQTINKNLSLRENRGGYTVLDGEPTIEHILPQTPSDQWKTDIGENFNVIYDQYLHTIGNLTLVTSEWNSDLSNSPFIKKKTKLSEHALYLNQKYFQQSIQIWNDQTILSRAKFLLKNIVEVWPAIGDIPTPKQASGTRPVRMILLGQEFEVDTWRDVAEKTTEAIIQMSDNFDVIANEFSYYLSREPFPKANRQLSNGLYMNVNLSASSIKRYCRKLVNSSGLAPNDWQVEEQ